ncbi:MAG: RecX family transcriptional regulator [Anaerolineae bacterium]|nr:RecX family transcriptional regulator [Anaerolineae bacterium]MDK1080372.1 RecX family transcriptional regulator [Anaerolineae bacterium]MDK1117483.1 RecX family transcriptional regulator [Anaerolineae bacterium]
MRNITAIEIQKKNSKRVNIYLDGEYAFGVARIVAAWLQTGQALDEAQITKLQVEDSRDRAIQQANLFLSYRARSEHEIWQNLRKHEYLDTVIEETIERLVKGGYLNDKQFASDWVENRSNFRPRGRRALALELRQKGIDESIIEVALEEIDDESLAYDAGLKKARKLKVQDWNEFRKKTSEFLSRRGFSYSVIVPIVLRLWNEIHPKEEDYLVNYKELK